MLKQNKSKLLVYNNNIKAKLLIKKFFLLLVKADLLDLKKAKVLKLVSILYLKEYNKKQVQ